MSGILDLDNIEHPDFSAPFHYHQSHEHPFENFQVFGERNSGTNFVRELITRNTGLPHTGDYGWKHGFPVAVAYHPRTLIVWVVRDPLDWTVSMFKSPHKARKSMDLDNFSGFIRSEWDIMVGRNLSTWRREWNATVAPDIGPLECMLERHPITGERFRNVLHMRSWKLLLQRSIHQRETNFLKVNYEYAKANREEFANRVRVIAGLSTSSEIDTVTDRVSGARRDPAIDKLDRTIINDEDLAFIRGQLDLSLEKSLGYTV